MGHPVYYYSVHRQSFFSIRHHFSYHVGLIVTSTLLDVSIKFLVGALPCSIFHLKLPHQEQREKSFHVESGKWVRYDVCLAVFFPKKKKKVTVSSLFLSHGNDFGDCDGTKSRFHRVTLFSDCPRDTLLADCSLVFSPHSAPLIFKRCLRVLPCDPTVSGVAPSSILEFSTFPSTASTPSRGILKVRVSSPRPNVSFNDAT